MAKKKSRASASRAKGAKKGAKKSAVKRAKSGTSAPAPKRQGLDVKKLKDDLGKAIKHLDDRISKRGPGPGVAETRDLFARWIMDIETTVCVPVNGPCGEDMFIGS